MPPPPWESFEVIGLSETPFPVFPGLEVVNWEGLLKH